jgi:ribonuclease VapC
MILLHTSAVLCALLDEPGSRRLKSLLGQTKLVAIGAPTLLEAGLVMASRSVEGRHAVEGFIRDCQAEVLEFRREHSEMALGAFLRFGKGRHPARLNFGDCMSYAFARMSGLKLVYTGDDFGMTDLVNLERLD